MALQGEASSHYENLPFSTAFVIMFFGFLMVGVMDISKHGRDASNVIQVSDVCFKNRKMHVTLR